MLTTLRFDSQCRLLITSKMIPINSQSNLRVKPCYSNECRVLTVAKLGRQFTSMEKIVIPIKVTTSANFGVFPAKFTCDCGGEANYRAADFITIQTILTNRSHSISQLVPCCLQQNA